MSRQERRAYKRMMKNQDPYALPAAATRARPRRPRAPRAVSAPGEFVFLSRRFLAWAAGGALVIGVIGFSIAWPNGMPGALYAGAGAAAVWLAVAIGFRFAQRRLAATQR
ncbi:MAG TPA: hypothetical protein VH987_07405 [Candidatus Limnocylindria bacterium]|jgi:hypothetical protein